MWYQKFQEYWTNDTLAQSDGDTGDSSQRLGTMWTLFSFIGITRQQLQPLYERSVKAHEVIPGRYRRSPIESFWGYDPTNFSRDQHSILMLAFASQKDKTRLVQAFKPIAKHLGFHQNFLRGTDDPTKYWKIPDFITISELTVFIRGMDLWFLYPFLLVLDIAAIADLKLRETHLWDADNMIAQNIFYACEKYPTPWSRVLFHLYGLTDWKARIYNYHKTGNGIFALHDLYMEAYDSLRRKYETNPFDRAIIRLIGLFHS